MKNTLLFFVLIAIAIVGCSGSDNQNKENNSAGTTPSGHLSYTVPEGWIKEQPSGSMRFAQYGLPGIDGMAPAELAVFFNIGGSVEANLQRWYGQFEQPDGRKTEDLAETKKVTVDGLVVTVIYVTGTYSASAMMTGGQTSDKPGYAMLAAMVETSAGPWQFKATGPEKTLSYWRDSFDEFVQSFTVK